jgi:hypothetical protein
MARGIEMTSETSYFYKIKWVEVKKIENPCNLLTCIFSIFMNKQCFVQFFYLKSKRK